MLGYSRWGVLLGCLCTLGYLGAPAYTMAAEVEFSAEVDRSEISVEESVKLRFRIEVQSATADIGNVSFDAPDFDLVNQYSNMGSQSFSIVFGGKTEVKRSVDQVKQLSPKKTGTFLIKGISVMVDGKRYAAKDLSVKVVGGGAGTPPPRNYGGGGGVGLRGSGKPSKGLQVFLRTEMDREKLYKGEQVLITYYLYTKAVGTRPEIAKFPSLEGFLREELELVGASPNGQLRFEPVVVDGEAYQRVPLARYAAYPIKTGKLQIDPLEAKVQYQVRRSMPSAGDLDEEDDIARRFFQGFGGFGNFGFGEPRISSVRSDRYTVDVLPLPEAGRPSSFTGAVGTFVVQGALDRTQVKTGDAVTFTIRVQGKGNASVIETPKLTLPEGVQLFESKSAARPGPNGTNEKIFEYLLIPRKAGTMAIEPVEFAFFDPDQKAYVTAHTEALNLTAVGESLAAPVPVAPIGEGEAVSSQDGDRVNPRASESIAQIRPAKTELTASNRGVLDHDWSRWIWTLVGIAILFVTGMGVQRFWSLRSARQKATGGSAGSVGAPGISAKLSREWTKKLKDLESQAAHSSGLPPYEGLAQLLQDILQARFGVSLKAHSRRDLEEQLIKREGVSPEIWSRVKRCLEYFDAVRYSSVTGAVSETDARSQFGSWVREVQKISADISPEIAESN